MALSNRSWPPSARRCHRHRLPRSRAASSIFLVPSKVLPSRGVIPTRLSRKHATTAATKIRRCRSTRRHRQGRSNASVGRATASTRPSPPPVTTPTRARKISGLPTFKVRFTHFEEELVLMDQILFTQ